MGFFDKLFSGNSSDIHNFEIDLFLHEEKPITTVYANGFLNKTQQTHNNVCIATSLRDITEHPLNHPICSMDTRFQESNTRAYQFKYKLKGPISPNSYLPLKEGVVGVPIAMIPFDALDPPKKGERKIMVISRVEVYGAVTVDVDGGSSIAGVTVLADASIKFPHVFKRDGYLDRVENLKKVKIATIQIAVFMAMADGKLHDQEGMMIKKWMHRDLSRFTSDTNQKKYKEIYNSTLQKAFSDGRNGSAQYSVIINRLNSVAYEAEKIEALSLCYKILAADGEAHKNELNVVKRLSSDLQVDPKEVEKIKDLTLISLDSSMQDEENIDAILSIDPDWDKKKIEEHLYILYDKWSGRLNAINEQEGRQEAQSWIDTIAEAMKKHGV